MANRYFDWALPVAAPEYVQTPYSRDEYFRLVAERNENVLRNRQRYAESAFNDRAKSGAGAVGAYQIMPVTYKDYLTRGRGRAGDLLDPEYNQKVRDFALGIVSRDLGDTWSDSDDECVRLAKRYAGYNWGAGNLKRYLRKQRDAGVDISGLDWMEGLPKETRDYVNFVAFGKDVPDTSKTMDAYRKAWGKFSDEEFPEDSLGGRFDAGGLIDRYGADAVRNALNAYKTGGGIHIKDSKKGTFTAAAKEHGKSVQAFASQVLANKDNYSPAMVKKANFARNAAKWHADGGLLKSFNGGGSTDGYVIAPDSQWQLPVSGRPAVIPPLLLEGELEPAVISAERVIRPSIIPANPLEAVAVSRDATAVPVIDLNIEPEPQLSFADYAKVAGALGENKERLINEQVNNLKSGEELKEFQKMLLAGGYYRNLPTPAIKAKTKNEIIALQEKLIDAGYDLGEYGADGTIGKYTRAAWKQYVKDHPDEALIESVADGLIGRNTREAARRYYEDITKVPDAVAMNSETEMPGLSRAMYNNIGKLEKVSNMLGTVLPAHVGAYVNKRENQRTGKRLGIEDYDGYLADTVEETLSQLNDALRSGNGEEVQRLRDSLRVQRDRLPLNRGNNLFLSNAEKQAVAAILTSLNGDRRMTYDDYLANLALLGKDDGAFLASNPRHRDASGKDVLLYGGRSGYHVMNDFEDERSDAGRDWHIVDGEGRVANILNAENRIFHEPMRGRLGAFSYYIDKDGNIHVQDRLEATEKKAARGKNDDQQYNGARDFFPRASTAPISGVITAKEYERFIRKARKKQTKGE